eukprot:GHVH01003515.1.p2 GENE.GHVH01003515.1~~GHVH01003515.1.p2  ORF type:complete len:108 (+),score=20.33 GHVH01003515.1:110-433(+)
MSDSLDEEVVFKPVGDLDRFCAMLNAPSTAKLRPRSDVYQPVDDTITEAWLLAGSEGKQKFMKAKKISLLEDGRRRQSLEDLGVQSSQEVRHLEELPSKYSLRAVVE